MTIWHKDHRDIFAAGDRQGRTMIDHLGIEVVEVGDDWLKARMPVDHRTV